MPSLPAKLAHGDNLQELVPTINALIECVRAITPHPSPTARVRTLPSGTVLSARPAARVPAPRRGGGGGDSAYARSHFAVTAEPGSDGVVVHVNAGLVFLPSGNSIAVPSPDPAPLLEGSAYIYVQTDGNATASLGSSASLLPGGAGQWICHLARVEVSHEDDIYTATVIPMHFGDVTWQ